MSVKSLSAGPHPSRVRKLSPLGRRRPGRVRELSPLGRRRPGRVRELSPLGRRRPGRVRELSPLGRRQPRHLHELSPPGGPRRPGRVRELSPPAAPHRLSGDQSSRRPHFSDEELTLFSVRFEEDYDIKSDARYNQWLQEHHPELLNKEATLPGGHMGKEKSSGVVYLQHSSTLSRLISVPQPVLKPPQVRQRTSARVLTSTENLLLIAEKEKKKEDEKKIKAQSKDERDKKRREGNERKEQKRVQRERKALETEQKKKEEEIRREQKRRETEEKQAEKCRHSKTKISDRRASQAVQVTSEQVSVQATSQQSTHRVCSTADRMSTDCVASVCSHKKAYKWIECQQCARWYHCVCWVDDKSCKCSVHMCRMSEVHVIVIFQY